MTRRSRIWISRLLLSCGSVLLVLGISEVAARLFWGPPLRRLEPSIKTEYSTNRSFVHAGITYDLNSLGLRDHEYPLERTANSVRILCVGDSFTFGHRIRHEETVPKILEQHLVKNRPFNGVENYEVINAGGGGTEPFAQWQWFESTGHVLEPDLIIQFFFQNDIMNPKESKRPLIYRINWSLRTHSSFYAMLQNLYKTRVAAHIRTPAWILPYDLRNLPNQAGWLQARQGYNGFVQWSRENNAAFMIVIIPSLTTFGENYPFMEIHELVTAYCSANGLLCLDLLPFFANEEPSELWVTPSDPHWNVEGTSIAARAVYELLVQQEGQLFEQRLSGADLP